MLFKYKTLDNTGAKKDGSIEAPSKDLAISALQRRGLIVVSVVGEEEKKSVLQTSFMEKVSMKDIVIMSKQISTLFDAQVSALKAFTMLSQNVENPLLGRKLRSITDDIQAGTSISGALAKYPDVFSNFYVNMVKAGEESGKLNETFLYLAEYLDRQYALTTKTRNALIYPGFVIAVFIAVMVMMFVVVIPKLSEIILESGQEVPLYTKIVIATSNFFVDYGIFIVILVIVGALYLWRLSRSESGKTYLDSIKLNAPAFGNLYKKLYLSRIADNMNTMLSSGIAINRSIEITSEVVGNKVYSHIVAEAGEEVKTGKALSESFEKYPKEMPPIMVQMIKIGEETGAMSSILKTLAAFYKREVDDAVDTIVGLIEPIMIVVLGLGVGILLTSVLVPIYNIAGSIQ